jgi:hypothetical protein
MAKITKDAKTLTATTKVVGETVAQSATTTAATTVATTTMPQELPKPAPVEVVIDAPTPQAKPSEAWQADDWVISNQTPSAVAFPELGQQAAATVKPYTRDVAVQFKTAAMFEMFNANLVQLRALCGWNEVRGVFLHSRHQDEETI